MKAKVLSLPEQQEVSLVQKWPGVRHWQDLRAPLSVHWFVELQTARWHPLPVSFGSQRVLARRSVPESHVRPSPTRRLLPGSP
jgi:hypothetical protein